MYNKDYFFLSGLISFILYLSFFFFAFLYVSNKDVAKYDSSKKVTVLELDIVIDKDNKDIHKVNSSKVVDTKKSEDIVKKSASTSVKKRSNLKSLFADVKTDVSKIEKNNVSNVKESSVSSRFKSKFEKQQKNSSTSVSKYLDNIETKSSQSIVSESSNNKDEYYSKIYDIISTRWNPLVVMNGLFAKVIVTIYNDGSFDYKFLTKSGNEIFDDSLYKFLESQKSESFPAYEKGRSTDIEFTFKTKDE